MRMRNIFFVLVSVTLSQVSVADIAKHTTVNMDASGAITEYTEMVADDAGNLRIEIYAADAAGERGALKDFIVFQAGAQKMLTSSGGTCQSMSFDGEGLPGGVSRAEVAEAQAEMQKAMAEMRASNPEMAKMLESQMGNMAAMMGAEQSKMEIVQTGEERTIDGYDTIGFRVGGIPGTGNHTVWAADVDDVEGAVIISAASQKMMQAHKQMLEDMGMGQVFGTNVFGEIMEAMEDYYPIVTEDGERRTKLVSTDGNGSEEFNPACN